jgi:hypothetical protein
MTITMAMLALCARYPATTLCGYWCAHFALFGVGGWGSFDLFDERWWRDLVAHAVAGYTTLISLYAIRVRRRERKAGRFARFAWWFVDGSSYTRAACFGAFQGCVWEGVEFVLDSIRHLLPFRLAAAQGGVEDTILDIVVSVPLAVLAMVCIRAYEHRLAVRARHQHAAAL